MQLRNRPVGGPNANVNPQPSKTLSPKKPAGVQKKTKKPAAAAEASKKKPALKLNPPKKAVAPKRKPKKGKEKGAAAAPKAKGKGKGKPEAKGKAKATAADEEEEEEYGDDDDDDDDDDDEAPETPQHPEDTQSQDETQPPDPTIEANAAAAVAQAALASLNEAQTKALAASKRFPPLGPHLADAKPVPGRKRARADAIPGPPTRPTKVSKKSAAPTSTALPPFAIEIQPPNHRGAHPSTPRHKPLRWGRHTLPPFGAPIWRRDKSTNTPILLLPIAISVEEEVRALRELADEDPERYEGEYVDFVRGLREKEYRGLNGGFVGAVLDEFDRDDETRRRAGGGREIDENYDDSTSSSDYIEGGDEQNGQDGQKESGMQNEPEEPDEPENQNETANPEKQSEQHKKDHRRSETPSPSPRPEPSGSKGQPSKSPVKPLLSSPPPPPPSPSPPPSTSENQPTDVESNSSHTPIPGKETFESKHPLYKPMPYDAPEGMTLRGPLQPGDEKRLGVDMAGFIRSHHGYEEGWVGRKFLGQGAAGRAGMWEKRDADKNVVDRVCIKQTQEPTFSEYKWDKPFEVEVMEDLQDPANNGTVQLRGYRRYPKSRAHRIYMEYCEHGNLEGLISKYRSKRQYIPEEFIWDAFYHLANACRAMDRGPSRPEDKRRDIYIHRDIKPDNIFLAAPGGYNEDCIPIYPTTKLGDFGLAKATGLEDPLNPSAYKGRGTIGYRPPEQKVPAHIPKDYSKEYQDEFVYAEITNDEPKFRSESNVWGVGACIYKFMWLTDASYDFHDKMKENEEVIPKIETTRTPEYSQELRDLVHECLNFSPLKRPALSTLIDRVGQARARFREQWKETRKVPSESLLYYTDEAVEKMDFGTWVKRRHVHEEPPPTSYSYLSDPSLDEEEWDRITDLINDF